MKITRDKAAMLCMALKTKINELSQLPEPVGTSAASAFVELYQEIYNEFLSEQKDKNGNNP